MKKIYWQGDVGFEPIKEIPKNAIEKNLTVALGEITGHHHTFREGTAQVLIEQEQQFVRVIEKQAILEHQEHDLISLPQKNYLGTNTYKVVRQRVFNTLKGIRQVMD